MNNFKKIGLTALAASLVSVSANAGALSMSGAASMNVGGYSGDNHSGGATFSMGNQFTVTGGGELDNGMTVSLSFELDKGEGNAKANAPFDSHSLTISSDSMGTLKFSGHGGSSSTSAIDGTAAGDLWDNYDAEDGLEPTGVGSGDNMIMYTLPSMMDDLSLNVSYLPTGSTTDSALGYGATYSGVEGLSVSYATGDDSTVGNTGTGTVMEASYAIGSITAAYSDYEYDTTGTASDDDVTGYKLTYTVSDDLSVSYASEEVATGPTTKAEYDEISASYTTGGMTITASMGTADDRDGTTTATMDNERWALGASFAF